MSESVLSTVARRLDAPTSSSQTAASASKTSDRTLAYDTLNASELDQLVQDLEPLSAALHRPLDASM